MGSDDPAMGWSRYCETMVVSHLSAALFLAQPTFEAVAVARRMYRLASEWGGAAAGAAWASGPAEAEALSTELLAPSHDEVRRVGASVRILNLGCWLNARVALSMMSRLGRGTPSTRYAGLLPGRNGAVAEARQAAAVAAYHKGEALGDAWSEAGTTTRNPPRWQLERTSIDPLMRRQVCTRTCLPTKGGARHLPGARSILLSPTVSNFTSNRAVQVSHGVTKRLVLRSHCSKSDPDLHSDTRPLNFIAPAGAKWPINCEEDDNSRALCEVVRRVAVGRAIMAAVSNRNILPMLGQFVDIVKQASLALPPRPRGTR